MEISIRKRADGSGVLRCRRADGSVTWQRQDRHAAFFALHDLTHFAVETVLGYSRGFFGLVSEGWEMEETTGQEARGPVPAEALEVEKLVGLLDAERAGGVSWSAADFNAVWGAGRELTEADLAAVRGRRAELFRRWEGVEAGGA